MKHLILWALLLTTPLFSDVTIYEDFTYTKASPFMEYFLDINNEHTVDTIKTAQWKRVETTNFGGFHTYASWTRFGIVNKTQKVQNLVLKNPRASMDEVDIYIFKEDVLAEYHRLGDNRSIKERLIAHRYSIASLNLQPGERAIVLSRLVNRINATEGECEVYLHSTFSEFSMLESMWWGLYSGFSLSLLCYLALLSLASKDKIFVFLFGLYVFCTLGYQLSTNGILYSFGLSEQYINFVTILFGSLFGLFTIFVVLRFLKLSHYQGIIQVVLRFFVIALMIQIIILCLSLIFSYLIQLAAYMSIYIGLIAYFVWFLLLKGFLTLSQKGMFRYMFLGYTTIVMAYAYQALTIVGLIEINFLTTYAVSIGSIVEMYFFAIAVTLYVRHIQKEKEKQSKLIDYQMRFISIGKVIGNIVHQWKIPLVRLGGLITHIEAIIYDKNSTFKEIEDIIPQMRSNCSFMKNTIDEFYLLYSQHSHKVTFTFSKVINDIWGMLGAKALASNVTLLIKNGQEIAIESYEHSFAHIMLVLMENAIDAAKQRSIVNPIISVEILQEIDYIKIIIEDNCGGIQHIPIASIFELDVSSKQEQHNKGGIGLSIVKTLVCDKLFGNICVENTSEGVRFIITLPTVF